MQQLNQQDTMFLYSETPRVPMHISSLHIYDPSTASEEMTFERMVEHVRSRLPLTRILRRKLVRVPLDLDYPYWVEDRGFDLEYHVRNIALPRPGTWSQLWVQTARLHSQPLDLSRPPWELYLIDGLEQVAGYRPDSFGMFIKVHHAAIDGMSGIELMNALHDLAPEGRTVADDAWRAEADPSPLKLLTQAASHVTAMPGRAWQLMSKSIPRLPTLQAETLRGQPAPTLPRTRLNGAVTTHRVGDGFRFDLATAKQLRGAVPGSTVNDVVLAVVGGGLRSYLAATTELPSTPLYAGVPISLRTEEDTGTAGNKISIMLVSLATDVADPIERLRAVQRSTSASKEQSTAESARTMAEAGELLPGALLGAAVHALPQLGAGGVTSMIGNVCVTNVPGSQVPLYLCGARMDAYYGLGPVFDHAGPIHLIVSYCGHIYLAVTSCREIIPDIERYITCLEESWSELVAASEPAASRPRRRTGSRSRATPPPARKRSPKADA